jgi:hypothetical protein
MHGPNLAGNERAQLGESGWLFIRELHPKAGE